MQESSNIEELRVDRRQTANGETEIVLSGLLTPVTAQNISTMLEKELGLTEKRLLLNMKELDFLSSGALSFLIRIQKKAAPGGRTLVIVDPSPLVEKVLKISRTEKIFPLEYTSNS